MLLTAPGLRRYPSVGPGQTGPRGVREVGELLAFAVLVLGAGWVERHGAGLDGLWSVAPGLLTTIPVIVLGRAWRLPLTWIVGAAALPVSILATASLAPGGWAGSERAAAYGYAALAFVAVAAFATTPARRLVASLALGFVVFDQFAQSWLAWWGSQDSTRMLAGSFNWHNQYGVFCGAGVVLLATLALTAAPPRLRGASTFVTAVLVTGLLGSASRASVLATAVACALVGVVAVRSLGLLTTLRRGAVLVVTSLAVGVFLRSTVFFGEQSWPWAALLSRSVQSAVESGTYESVGGNASARLSYWQAGADMFGQHPALGTGLSTFGDASRWSIPLSVQRTVDPHNELVRAAAEGGALGAAPVAVALLAAAAVAVLLVRHCWATADTASVDPGAVGGVLAAGALGAHAMVDFDWSYPSLTMVFGWCLALGVGLRATSASTTSRSGRGVAVGLLVLTAVAALVGGAVNNRTNGELASVSGAGSPYPQVQADIRRAWMPWAPDHRLPLRALALARADDAAPPTWAVVALRRRASIDSRAALATYQAEFAAGDRTGALQRLRVLARRDPLRGADLVLGYADLLRQAGRTTEAAETSARLLVQRAAAGSPVSRGSAVFGQAEIVVATSPQATACLDLLASDVPHTGFKSTPCQGFTEGDVVR